MDQAEIAVGEEEEQTEVLLQVKGLQALPQPGYCGGGKQADEKQHCRVAFYGDQRGQPQAIQAQIKPSETDSLCAAVGQRQQQPEQEVEAVDHHQPPEHCGPAQPCRCCQQQRQQQSGQGSARLLAEGENQTENTRADQLAARVGLMQGRAACAELLKSHIEPFASRA